MVFGGVLEYNFIECVHDLAADLLSGSSRPRLRKLPRPLQQDLEKFEESLPRSSSHSCPSTCRTGLRTWVTGHFGPKTLRTSDWRVSRHFGPKTLRT